MNDSNISQESKLLMTKSNTHWLSRSVQLKDPRICAVAITVISAVLGSCSTNNSLSDEEVTAVIQGTDVEFVNESTDQISAYYRSSEDDSYYVQGVNSMGELVGEAQLTSFEPGVGSDVSLRGDELWHSIHRYAEHDDFAQARHDISSIGSKVFAYRYELSEPIWSVQLEDDQHCHRNAVDSDANLYCWTDQELLMINPEGGVSSTGSHGTTLDEENDDGDAFFIAGRFVFFSTNTIVDESGNAVEQTSWTIFSPYSGLPATTEIFATSDGGGVLTAPAIYDEILMSMDENTLYVQHPFDGDILVSRIDIQSATRTHSTRLSGTDGGATQTPKAFSVSNGQIDVDINGEVFTLNSADLSTVVHTSVRGTLLGSTADYLFTGEESAASTWVRRFDRGTASTDNPVIPTPPQDTEPTADPTLQQAPVNLRVEIYSDSAFELFWQIPDDAICPCTHSITMAETELGQVDGTSFYQDGYSPGEYTFSVYRINANQEQSSAAEITVQLGEQMTSGNEMPLPAGIRYTLYSPTSLELFWDNPNPGLVTSFEIYRDGVLLDTRSTTSFFDQGLTPDTEYEYGIAALDAFGNRSLTAIIRLRTDPETVEPVETPVPVVPTPSDPPVEETPEPAPTPSEPSGAIQPPTNLHWSALSDDSIQLVWDEPTGAVGGVQAYEIFRNGLSYDSVSDPVYLEFGMDPDAEYVYTVVAVDWAKNRSAASQPIVVRIRDQRPDAQSPQPSTEPTTQPATDPSTEQPPEDNTPADPPADDSTPSSNEDDHVVATGIGSAPNAPRNLRISVYSFNSMELFWDPAIDPDGGAIQAYEVFRNGESYASVSGTSYIEFGMDPSATYTYTVVAVDWDKNRSAVSESIQVRTGEHF